MADIAANGEEELLRRLIDAVPDLIFLKDAAGQYLTCNKACAEYFGMTAAEIVGRTDFDLVNPEIAEFFRRQDTLAAASGQPRCNEEWVVRPNGERMLLETSKTPLFGEDGQPLGIIGISRDITGRKGIEDALRESERRFRVMFEQASDAMFLHDEKGRVVDVNEAACRTLGYSRDELIGAQPEGYVIWSGQGPQGAIGPSGALEYVFSGGDVAECPIHRRKDGSTFPVETIFRRLEFGGRQFILAVARDVTERKRAEDALKTARAAAEAANKAKTNFLAAASHDLRQPVQALTLLLHLLNERQGCDEQADIRAKMAVTLGSTADMLAKLMDYAALESGGAVVKNEVFRLDGLVRTIAREEEENAAAKGLRLRVHAPPSSTESDPVLLGRILRNLIRNAIVYTERGGVLVAIRKRGTMTRIEIWDSGSGIPPAERDKVFEELYQTNNPGRDRDKGVGLGLAIVRKTAQALGHRLSVRSSEGRGSVFAVDVPWLAADGGTVAADPAEEAEARCGATVLIVEDDHVQAAALKSILCQLGYMAVAARDGASALDAAAQLPEPPHLVISDYRLPGTLNGVEAVSALREAVGRPIAAILVTGDTQAAVAEQAERIGCAVVHKPFSPIALIDLIDSLLAERGRNAA
ncbi:MAG: PAS domain S-box protein [Magnetospirillum sp.]|nr:PAS domain S-box protein [Magnetospirillum sp.]